MEVTRPWNSPQPGFLDERADIPCNSGGRSCHLCLDGQRDAVGRLVGGSDAEQAGSKSELTSRSTSVANAAIFSEGESRAAHFLQQQELTRFDSVNFIADGVRKDGGRPA